jgi:hypothetical protein
MTGIVGLWPTAAPVETEDVAAPMIIPLIVFSRYVETLFGAMLLTVVLPALVIKTKRRDGCATTDVGESPVEAVLVGPVTAPVAELIL